MTDLTLPIIRFETEEDCRRGLVILADQQFETRLEGKAEVSVSPWEDLEDAFVLLEAEGVLCARAEKHVNRLGSQQPRPLPGL